MSPTVHCNSKYCLPSSRPQVLGTTSKTWLQALSSEQSCRAMIQLMAALEGPGVTNPMSKEIVI